MKSDVSPIFLTYYMVKWHELKQYESPHRCQTCARPLNRTEEVVDAKGLRYEGYVCHSDKQVTWVKAG